MKVAEEELTDLLYVYLKNYSQDKNIKENIEKDLVARNVNLGTIRRIMSGSIPLYMVDRKIIFLLTEAFYETTKKAEINPNKFFTDQEMIEASGYSFGYKKENIYPIVFDGFYKINDDQWFGVLSIQRIVELANQMVLNYNTKTQRQTTLKISHNSVIEVATVHPRSVRNISDRIVRGKQITNFITLNILKTGEEKYEYNYRKNQILVYDGKIDMLDGFHRIMGMIMAYSIMPDSKFTIGVMITNFTIEKAREFIRQEEYKNKMNPVYVKTLDDNLDNTIINEIDNNKRFELNGKMTTNPTAIKLNIAIIDKGILLKSIRNNFKYKLKEEAYDIADYLVKGINRIVALYPDDFLEPANSKRKKVITYPNMFAGYIALLADIKNNNNWEEILQNTLDSLNMDIDNPDWNELGIFKDRLIAPDYEKIKEYFLNKEVK